MDINEIREYFVDQYLSSGFEPDDYCKIAVPKHIRYILTKQILSLNPTEDMITHVFKEVMKLYFEALPGIVSCYYSLDKSRKTFEKVIKNTIKRFWPRKHIPISDEYYKIFDIVSEIAAPMTIWKKSFYIEQLPHYIEGGSDTLSIIEDMFEDHLPPVEHMWEIECIIRETQKKMKAKEL